MVKGFFLEIMRKEVERTKKNNGSAFQCLLYVAFIHLP